MIDEQQARKSWGRACANLAEMEKQILKLVRHPDVTTEELLKAHAVYKEVHSSMMQTRAELEKQFPRKHAFLANPWRIK